MLLQFFIREIDAELLKTVSKAKQKNELQLW